MRCPAPLFLLACLALPACGGGGGWHKPGAGAEGLKQDLGECQALAYDKVGRHNPALPPVALDRRFGGHADGPTRPTEDRIREQQAVDACMRDKGYRFEPTAR